MWEAVWGGYQPQPWHYHIIFTPQVKASPAHLITAKCRARIVSLFKCLQSVSEVQQSVTWVYQWHMHIDQIMCSNTIMLGHVRSKLVKIWQKAQHYTHQKHGRHVWHAQWSSYGHFFQTFRISCGEWVEQVRSLRYGIGAFEILTNIVLDPLILPLIKQWAWGGCVHRPGVTWSQSRCRKIRPWARLFFSLRKCLLCTLSPLACEKYRKWMGIHTRNAKMNM